MQLLERSYLYLYGALYKKLTDTPQKPYETAEDIRGFFTLTHPVTNPATRNRVICQDLIRPLHSIGAPNTGLYRGSFQKELHWKEPRNP